MQPNIDMHNQQLQRAQHCSHSSQRQISLSKNTLFQMHSFGFLSWINISRKFHLVDSEKSPNMKTNIYVIADINQALCFSNTYKKSHLRKAV